MNENSPHIGELLPEYLNGTLEPNARVRVDRHLQECGTCQHELKEWRALNRATVNWYASIPDPSNAPLERVKARMRYATVNPAQQHVLEPTFNLPYLWQLVVGQIWLVHRGIWVAAPLTIAIGVVVGFVVNNPDGSGIPLALIAPFVAAVSLALIYGPENDPSLELALSTPTPPRLVVMSRMTLVFAYDLVIALVATGILAWASSGTGLWQLISMWVAPMLFLSAFALTTSLVLGTAAAIAGSLGLWVIRVFALAETELNPNTVASTVESINGFWESSPLLVALFVCMLFVIFLSIPRGARFA